MATSSSCTSNKQRDVRANKKSPFKSSNTRKKNKSNLSKLVQKLSVQNVVGNIVTVMDTTPDQQFISNRNPTKISLYSRCQALARKDIRSQTESVGNTKRFEKYQNPQILRVQSRRAELVACDLQTSRQKLHIGLQNGIIKRGNKIIV